MLKITTEGSLTQDQKTMNAVVKAINTHIKNADVCYTGCYALNNVLIGCAALQKEACEKGSLRILLRVLKEHSDSEKEFLKCVVVLLESFFHP